MELKLPLSVVSQVDVARLLRELSDLEDYFVAAAARKAGAPQQPPKATRLLEQVAEANQINLLDDKSRKSISAGLNNIFQGAPLLHISFAAEPSVKGLEQILGWMRTNLHPYVLLQVGLQPTIAAGCVLRTNNRVFDMSLRNYLKEQEPYLVQLIQGAVSGRR